MPWYISLCPPYHPSIHVFDTLVNALPVTALICIVDDHASPPVARPTRIVVVVMNELFLIDDSSPFINAERASTRLYLRRILRDSRSGIHSPSSTSWAGAGYVLR